MTEWPKRRRNRLENYDYASPGAYFVTVCVKEYRNLLGKVVVGADDHIGPYAKCVGRIKTFQTLVTKAAGVPLFQRSFYDHVVRNEADALRIRESIRKHPARWTEDRFYIV